LLLNGVIAPGQQFQQFQQFQQRPGKSAAQPFSSR
jgi:hypothetical protein